MFRGTLQGDFSYKLGANKMTKVNELLSTISGGKILDVGCGVGWFIQRLKENLKDYEEIIGIDVRDDVLEKARIKHTDQNIEFLNMDATEMTYADNYFDIVSISNTLHHLPEPALILEEMNRVLKPGGLFIIGEMFCDNQSEKQLSHVILHHLQGEMDMLIGVCHRETYKKEELISIAKDLGLEITDTIEYNTHEEQKQSTSEEEQRDTLDEMFSALEKHTEKLGNEEQQQYFLNRLNGLKDDMYKIGFFTATQLLLIAKKN